MQRSYTLLLFLCLVGSTISAQQVWDNFEDIRQGTYDFISGTLIPYSENPDKTGANTSLVAASYTRNASEAFDVILLDAPVADLSDYISGAKQMSIAVYSPAAGKTVQITLENSATAEPQNFPVGRHSIYQTTTTVANSWEVLTFSLTEQPDMSVGNDGVNRLVLLFDPGNAAGDTYIFDDLNGPELADDPCDGATANPMILEDFECNQNLRYIFSHSGVNFRRVDNPDQNGNTSDKVATYTRNGGEMVDVIISRFGSGNLSVSGTSEIAIDVWDPTAPSLVRLSLQAANGDVILAIDANTSQSETWETLRFDTSPATASMDIAQLVILFDPDTNNSDNYFFDNITVDNSVAVVDLPEVSAFSVAPNPSPGRTLFQYELLQNAEVELSVYDLTGKRVATLLRERQVAGAHQAEWNADNLANGLYYYTLMVDGSIATGKVALSR